MCLGSGTIFDGKKAPAADLKGDNIIINMNVIDRTLLGRFTLGKRSACGQSQRRQKEEYDLS